MGELGCGADCCMLSTVAYRFSSSHLPSHMTHPPHQPDEITPGWITPRGNTGASDHPSGGSQGEGFMQDATRGPRLQKVLAAAGIGSRRACETLVAEGAVCVNGIVIQSLPAWVDPQRDSITVNGSRVKTGAPSVCVMLFKPRGVICSSSDPEERRQVVDLVQHPSKVRLYSIGRLDMDSSGLLLLTNDGDLSQLLSHPSNHVHRIYEVSVNGQVEPGTIRRLERGITLTDEHSGRTRLARFHSAKIIRAQRDRTKMRVVLTEGRNRQIRRMMLALGHPVRKLRRVAIGPLKLDGLQTGQWRDLTERELRMLVENAKRKTKKKSKKTARPRKKTEKRTDQSS